MPPPLPRNTQERQAMWGPTKGDVEALVFHDPFQPADHLDEETQNRVALFPEMTSYLRSRFGLSPKTDPEWFPVRPLGKGGFGGVAVWERRDVTGNVVEETAVKETEYRKALASSTEPFLAKEAIIMEQLNKMNSENIVYLKGFKCFNEQKKQKATWRFYFEYCPYGDLSRLAKRYQAWGTYFPEEFVWRTFHSMAVVASIMERGPFADLDTGIYPKTPYVLVHSDIKPMNIFLGYHVDPTSPWHVYPVVKVGDWGLARLTSVIDPENPVRFVKNGTAMYLPPECRPKKDTNKYVFWQRPPFNFTSIRESEYERTDGNPDYTDRKVDSSHNVWAFGMTMHELMTHESTQEFSYRLDCLKEDEYLAWGQNTTDTLSTHNQPEYSEELRDLIRWCLNLRPSLRPTVEEILEITGNRIDTYAAEVAKTNRRVKSRAQEATNTYQLPQVYFKENEINDMPLGPYGEYFGRGAKNLANFAFEEDKYAAPIWGPIKHPNRAAFAARYQNLVKASRFRAGNENGKRIRDAFDFGSPQPKRNKLRDLVKDPAHAFAETIGVEEGTREVLAIPRDPFVNPAPAQSGNKGSDPIDTPRPLPPPPGQVNTGFMAINTARGQQVQREAQQPRHQGRVLDSVDRALLESFARASVQSDGELRRNVRKRRMRLWDDNVMVPEEPDDTLMGGT